jgi:hypothetical protein
MGHCSHLFNAHTWILVLPVGLYFIIYLESVCLLANQFLSVVKTVINAYSNFIHPLTFFFLSCLVIANHGHRQKERKSEF